MAIIGHTFPVYFGFKGGKGVATSLGVIINCKPANRFNLFSICIIVMALTRMVSLGSILAAILFPVLTVFIMDNIGAKIIYILIGALVIFNHRTNIVRIINGTENKLYLKNRKELL